MALLKHDLVIQSMEKLRPDVDWSDEDRVSVLFGPFRARHLNPEAWQAKMTFWQGAIEAWLLQEHRLSFTLSDLQAALHHKGRKPHCLPDVIQFMLEDKSSLKTLSDLQHKLTKGQATASWSAWTLGLVKTGASGLFQKVIGNQTDLTDQTMLIHMNQLDAKSKWIIDKMRSSSDRFSLNKSSFIEKNRIEELKMFPCSESDLLLQSLQSQNLCDVHTMSDGRVFVKFVEQKSDKSSKFVQEEIDFIRLRCCSEELSNSVDATDREIEELRSKVRLALKEKSRSRAKQFLRKAKRLEATVEKKRNLLDNIDQILESLESAKTNALVAENYSLGLSLLKKQLTSMKTVEETNDLLDDIREMISDGEAISEAMGTASGEDDLELMEELERLSSESEKTKSVDDDLLAKLNSLSVEDTSLPSKASGDRIVSEKKPDLIWS